MDNEFESKEGLLYTLFFWKFVIVSLVLIGRMRG
jgi:hypothetical protein